MVSAAPVSLGRARRIASVAHVVAVVACVLIVVMIASQSVIPAITAYFSADGSSASRLNGALTALIPALPLVFFFLSLFRLRQALDHYSDGEFFSPKPGRHIASAGVCAVLALMAAIAAPALQAWVAGTRFPFELEPVMAAMLAFALFVMIVGRILE